MPRERKPRRGSAGTGAQSPVPQDEDPGHQRARVASGGSPGSPQKPHLRIFLYQRTIGAPYLTHFWSDVGFGEPRPAKMHRDLGYRPRPKDDTPSAVVSHI